MSGLIRTDRFRKVEVRWTEEWDRRATVLVDLAAVRKRAEITPDATLPEDAIAEYLAAGEIADWHPNTYPADCAEDEFVDLQIRSADLTILPIASEGSS